ncbi:MAG: protein-disulfide reductase DsbD family protein [Hyphomonadaceae bacterium]
MLRWIAAFLALTLAFAAPAHAQILRTDHAEHELVSSVSTVAPGQRFTIALNQRIVPGWHTYWTNPGDSGEPTDLTWSVPRGFTIGELRHPAPHPISFDIVMSYAHQGDVLYPIEIVAPETLRPGESVTLNAHVFFLVCDDICLTEEGDVSLTLPVAADSAPNPQWAPRIEAAVQALPRDRGFDARITPGSPARLTVSHADLSDRAGRLRNLYFFPFAADVIRHVDPQRAEIGARGVSFSLTEGSARNLGEAPLAGIITYEEQAAGRWSARSAVVNATPGQPLGETSGAPDPASNSSAGAANAEGALGLPLAILFAFLGGIILNIMPCVLPVISIKALALAGGVHDGSARRHGLLYAGGVLAAFAAFAGALIAIQSAGQALGWGFHFQSPLVVGALALLFFAIGLNLLGVFAIGGSLQNAGGSLANRGGDAGAFFVGVLAVVAATPCTAPFMAGATGVAITQSPVWMLAIFLALGAGFALPFLALSFMPALQRLIPAPGPWMERLKQALAFPMFATAAWLAWVLTGQAGAQGVLVLLALAVALGFAIWALTSFKSFAWRTGLVALALIFATGVWFATRPSALASEPWSADRVAALQAEGRPVLVNFTADWCVTCKVNEGMAFARPRVADAFASQNVAYLVGDWTNRNDSIAAELARHGRAGVPLYLYYAPGSAEPRILPQILTEQALIDVVTPQS